MLELVENVASTLPSCQRRSDDWEGQLGAREQPRRRWGEVYIGEHPDTVHGWIGPEVRGMTQMECKNELSFFGPNTTDLEREHMVGSCWKSPKFCGVRCSHNQNYSIVSFFNIFTLKDSHLNLTCWMFTSWPVRQMRQNKKLNSNKNKNKIRKLHFKDNFIFH